MTSAQKNKCLLTDQMNQHKADKYDTLIKSQQQNQSDSMTQQKQVFVESILRPEKAQYLGQNVRKVYEEQDQDIKRFLEEQVPGLYSNRQKQGTRYQEEQQDSYSYYNNSIAPEYSTMSRFQKQNFFDNLNASYMARLNNQKIGVDKGRKGCDSDMNCGVSPIKRRKRAIKFNEIVFQVPFNKQEQPMAVKGTPEEQAYVTFDDAAYECSSSSQEQNEVQANKYASQTSSHSEDMESSECEDDQGSRITSRLSRQRLEAHEHLYQIFTESQASYSSSQNPVKYSNSTILSSSEDQEAPNKFKRSSSRRFASQSDESQEQNLAQDNREGEDQFIHCRNGRKVSPDGFNFKIYTNLTTQIPIDSPEIPIDSLESATQTRPSE